MGRVVRVLFELFCELFELFSKLFELLGELFELFWLSCVLFEFRSECFALFGALLELFELIWLCCELFELFGELFEVCASCFGICSGRPQAVRIVCDLFGCSTSRVCCSGSRSGRSGRCKDGPGSCWVVPGVV